MENLKIISTSHIAKESVDEINKAIDEWDPDIVAVELDYKRLNALAQGEHRSIPFSAIRRIGFLGFLFARIGSYVQRKLGGIVGMTPGSEMLAAVNEAGKRSKQIFLIDQDIEITLMRLSNEVTTKEKFKLVWELLSGFFKKEEMVRIDLSKVPEKELIKKLKGQLKESLPNLYRVLVEERNEVMARNIKNIMDRDEDKKILVVMGAGHTREVEEALRNIYK